MPSVLKKLEKLDVYKIREIREILFSNFWPAIFGHNFGQNGLKIGMHEQNIIFVPQNARTLWQAVR